MKKISFWFSSQSEKFYTERTFSLINPLWLLWSFVAWRWRQKTCEEVGNIKKKWRLHLGILNIALSCAFKCVATNWIKWLSSSTLSELFPLSPSFTIIIVIITIYFRKSSTDTVAISHSASSLLAVVVLFTTIKVWGTNNIDNSSSPSSSSSLSSLIIKTSSSSSTPASTPSS